MNILDLFQLLKLNMKNRRLFRAGFFLFLSISLYISTYGQLSNRGVNLEGFSTEYYSLPFRDFDDRKDIQYIVDIDKDQYLGHPTTHLLEDGKTLLVVYPEGHGRGSIVYKRSVNGGKNWSSRLPVPNSWTTSLEVPTLFPVTDASGTQRLIMFSGLYPTRMAVSENQGLTWSELDIVGDWGGIVVMSDLINLRSGPGHYMAMFHDDGRFFSKYGWSEEDPGARENNLARFTLYTTFSYDGGLTGRFRKVFFHQD